MIPRALCERLQFGSPLLREGELFYPSAEFLAILGHKPGGTHDFPMRTTAEFMLEPGTHVRHPSLNGLEEWLRYTPGERTTLTIEYDYTRKRWLAAMQGVAKADASDLDHALARLVLELQTLAFPA